ncbi:MAG: hypothetical protein IJW92_02795 [Clostridia bacterium]|nr:hypothetical protein [Clostridia bacterium]
MEDWRLNGQEEYLSNVTLYRIVFPDFWKQACAEENDFYQMIKGGPTTYIRDENGRFIEVEKEPIPIEEAALYWHEHCEFCWDKAMTNIEGEFYCTKDMRFWICAQCFHDFKDQFGWTVKPADALFQ